MDKHFPGWLPGQGRRGWRAGGTAARGRQGSPEASARALGLLRPWSPRPSELESERSQSAAGSQSGRTRGGGWQERRRASRRISLLRDRATRAPATRTRGPGPAPTVRAPRNPAPQLGVVGTSPRPPGGWQGQGLGVSPRDLLAEATGRTRDYPPPPSCGYLLPPPRAPFGQSLGCCSDPCSPPPYPGALGTVCGSAACRSRNPRFWGGVLKKPIRE